MRFQGKITNWNDEKGFGFVEPNGGGTRAFVHIKSFVSRSRRPVEGDVIIYELAQVHILAQREHPFWTNVNTDSGST